MLVTGGDSGCLVTGDFSGCLATGGETGCLVTEDTGFLVTKVVLLLVWVSSKDWRFCNTGFIYNKKNKLHRPQYLTHRQFTIFIFTHCSNKILQQRVCCVGNINYQNTHK